MQSPEAFAGYWKRPDADAKAIQGCWYRTGDLGRFDEDGELYVIGRVDDMIISGGENIFPEEVEDTLARSTLVAGCAVVGMPDERLGAKVVAFVEPAVADLTPEQLDSECLNSGLARFKRPKEYVLVKASRVPPPASCCAASCAPANTSRTTRVRRHDETPPAARHPEALGATRRASKDSARSGASMLRGSLAARLRLRTTQSSRRNPIQGKPMSKDYAEQRARS